jgi:hypothetical protein
MTEEESRIIAHVLSTADGRCPVCVGNLAERMQEQFPSFDWKKLVKEQDELHDKLLEQEDADNSTGQQK